MEHSFKLIGMRGMIAAKMQESLHNMAQLTYHAECRAQAIVDHRAKLKAEGSGVSIEDLIIKAVSDTLHKCPIFNSRVEGKEVTVLKEHHISIAVSLPGGLVAPTIFDVQDKSLEEISAARKDLIARARTGKLTVPEMTGGSFTISNLGLRRIHYFAPITNWSMIWKLFPCLRMTIPLTLQPITARPRAGIQILAEETLFMPIGRRRTRSP